MQSYTKLLILPLFALFFFTIRYLQEIGYTDTIIDVRSNRVRSLLGLGPSSNNNNNSDALKEEVNGGGASGTAAGAGSSSSDAAGVNSKRMSESQGRRAPAKKIPPASLAEAIINDTEAAVMANFDFLAQEGVGIEVDDDDDDMSDDMDDEVDDPAATAAAAAATAKRPKNKTKVRFLHRALLRTLNI